MYRKYIYMRDNLFQGAVCIKETLLSEVSFMRILNAYFFCEIKD